jgi:hypothetical protein
MLLCPFGHRSGTPSPKNSRSRRGMARPKTSRALNGPAQIRSNIELRHTFRYVATSSSSVNVDTSQILSALGVMGITNTSVRDFCSSFKVNHLTIYTPPAAVGSSATCSITWPGANNSPPREYSDTSVSVSTPAMVSCSPPPQSLASFWQTGTGQTLFRLIAPSGSIIDMSVSYFLADSNSAGTATTVITSVAGVVYYLPLDGVSTHLLSPVSLNSTF